MNFLQLLFEALLFFDSKVYQNFLSKDFKSFKIQFRNAKIHRELNNKIQIYDIPNKKELVMLIKLNDFKAYRTKLVR